MMHFFYGQRKTNKNLVGKLIYAYWLKIINITMKRNVKLWISLKNKLNLVKAVISLTLYQLFKRHQINIHQLQWYHNQNCLPNLIWGILVIMILLDRLEIKVGVEAALHSQLFKLLSRDLKSNWAKKYPVFLFRLSSIVISYQKDVMVDGVQQLVSF